MAAVTLDDTAVAEIITSTGPGGSTEVKTFKMAGLTIQQIDDFFANDPAYSGGLFVGGGN